MNTQEQASLSRQSRWSKAALTSAALAATAFVVGCSHHHHDDEGVYIETPAPRHVVVVEQQPPPPAAVEVVYEPAPPEVVAVYDPELSPYGHWVTIGAYGRCWVYGGRHDGWRPYTNGHWVASDQGWLWVAEGEEAEWGATCYHYGRWYEDANEGWVWVPGRVWGPSWCAWREGGGYSAWAPLPPECGDGYAINAVVVDRYVRPERFVSVRTQYITEVNVHEHIEVNNVTIIQRTRNITNITYVNNRAVNRGVPVGHVETAVGHRIVVSHPKSIHDVQEARREVQAGHPVIYSPLAVESYAASHPVTRHEGPARNDEHVGGQTAEERAAEKSAKDAQIEAHKADVTAEHEKTAEERAAEKTAKDAADEDHKVQERAAMEKAAQEKAAQAKAEQEKIAQEREAKEKEAQERAAQEKAALEQRAAQEKAATEQKVAAEREAKEKAAEEKAAAEKAAREKAARTQGKQNGNNNPNDPNNPNKKPKPGENGQDPNAPK